MGKTLRCNRRKHISELLETRQLLSTYYIDVNAPGTTQDGLSWSTAYKSIVDVLINKSVAGNTLLVADGTYKPTTTNDRTATHKLSYAIRIYGGYAGYGATNPDARDPSLYPTILSGDIGTVGNNTDNSYHVITNCANDSEALLDGLTITQGNAYGTGTNQSLGGGIFNLYGPGLKLKNCIVSGNMASSGGGIFNPSVGSNIYRLTPTLTNCTFSGNSAYLGGGICNETNSKMNLTNCSFSENTASYGGGIYNLTSSPTLTSCSFSGNSASLGGGIYNIVNSAPTLKNCSFSGSSAGNNSGGGLYNNYSSPTLINCLFTGNRVSGNGGCIFNSNSSSPTLTNCGFSGNSAQYGAGIYNESNSKPVIANCTFTDNASLSGAIHNYFSSPTLTNSILWNNEPAPVFDSFSSPTISYCDIQGGYAGTGNINSDPLFVRNSSPGVDNVWGTADDDYGDLHLQNSSPCINKGLNSANTSTTDLAGNPRIVGLTIDLGVHEYIPCYSAASSSDVVRLISTGSNQYVLKDSADNTLASYSTDALQIDLGAGADTLILDAATLSQAFYLYLSNIESIGILNAPTTNLTLSPTQLTLNSANIIYSGSPTFTLQNPSINLISLSGNVSLKLANPILVLNSGGPSSIRYYLFNAATGAKPSIACDLNSSLAILENYRLHKTTVAGVPLSETFSQLFIQGATPGDANLDGVVDQNDLLVIFANLNKTDKFWLNGDVDQNGKVDLADLAIVQSRLSAPASMVLKQTPTARSKAPAKAKPHKAAPKVGVRR